MSSNSSIPIDINDFTMTSSFPSSPKQPRRLLSFLYSLLSDSTQTHLIHWVNKEEWELQIIEKQEIAKLYGAHIGSLKTTFDSMCRGLRLYVQQGIVSKNKDKMSTWKFLKPEELMQKPTIPNIDELSEFLSQPGVLEQFEKGMKQFEKFLESNPDAKNLPVEKQLECFQTLITICPNMFY